ncbi:hypothetical protein predicted by Glimmer/Critica [Acetobacter ghanensis]|uniref:Uncharacterized protein n=1 Tax=Acetobacter ghanensis TaxID=431306 RepID=A0A0U5F2R1_9PROT|nr:hypothetical protein predicted by Glimmer/Critica [Acetobacter ghanensis]
MTGQAPVRMVFFSFVVGWACRPACIPLFLIGVA